MTAVPAASAYSSSTDTATRKSVGDAIIDSIRQMFSLASVEYTIASGSITPAVAAFTLDTESDAASDTLANITTDNFPEGFRICLRLENTARIVTVTNNAGGDGEIFLRDGRDLVWPANTDPILCLERRGADWYEVWRVGFGVPTEASTAGSGAPNVITDSEASMPGGCVYTNEGAGAAAYHTLPAARAGLGPLTFVVQVAQELRVVAGSGDTIRVGATESASAGYVRSSTVGDVITLCCINGTEWIATSYVETWTVDS